MLALYVRVSTVLQIDNTSLDQQVELCKKLAYQKGFTDKDILIYREEGFSGEDIDIRPTMMKLREDVSEGLISHVICTHPDRLSRDLTDKLIVVREFEKSGAEIFFTDTEFEKSPEGILFFNIISAIASYELALIRKRTVRGRERAVRELKKIMPMRVAPFGYDKDENGQLIINTHEAQYVKMIYEWYIYENLTTREIGERLIKCGVMPKRGESKNWSASSIGRILSSEIYIGNYYYNRRQSKKVKGQTTKSGNPKRTLSLREEEDWLHVPVSPVIDQPLFHLAQKQKERNITNKHVGNQTYEFLLKSLLKCGHCGRTWDATTYSGSLDKETGKRMKYRCYRCPNLAPKKYGPGVKRCPSQSLRAELLEDYMWNQVVALVSEPEHYLKQIDQTSKGGAQELQLRVQTLEREIEQRYKEKEKVKLMFWRDVISEEEMITDLKRLNDTVIKLKQELNHYSIQIQTIHNDEHTLDKLMSFINHIQERLKEPEKLTFQFKRHIIEMFFNEIILRFESNDLEKPELVIMSVGAFDKLMQQKNDIGVRTQPQEIR
ncbi:recombinase family protein [Paenibacillus sp. PvR098]|uniref:recombinase family protein n=1 Tax=unclassified Paenibacillus TaxID=185978 RepID=UPI001B4EC3A5|nr:site-specific DNA recombinase [Paenibacillus sp. PvP091]MBP1168145.1 site-specific DNA recombinase [Paenibacillus sp. PvR098]MBP2439173.1 site-specific DNA recombinase [Paenibacillus sp. PvP052]